MIAGPWLSKMFLCNTKDSHVLHVPSLCVFALMMMLTAMSFWANSSTYTWQFPVPVSITGTVEFFTTLWMSPAPPLGIRTSKYSFNCIIFVAVSRLVSVSSWMLYFGILQNSSSLWITFVIARFELIASLPPRRRHAFPVLKHSANASAVTFGLDS